MKVEAIGISLDGNELKIAHLKKNRGALRIMSLERIFLDSVSRPAFAGDAADADDPFGLSAESGAPGASNDSAVDRDTLLYNILARYSGGVSAGLNILQSEVSAATMPVMNGVRGKQERKLVRENLLLLAGEIDEEAFDYIPREGNEYIVFYHNGNPGFLNEILSVRRFIRDGPTISLVDTNEISLINLFNGLSQVDDEKSILIFIGNEFSRVFFFHGARIVNFSQIINDGYRSPNVLENVYGKIIFEADALGFEEFRNVIIAGGGKAEEYVSFFSGKFPECRVDRLHYEEKFEYAVPEIRDEIDAFAVPVSLAWKILSGGENGFIDSNFLPEKIQKDSKRTVLSPAGLGLLILTVASLGFLYHQHSAVNAEIEKIQTETRMVEEETETIRATALLADSVAREIDGIMPKIALIDSLEAKTIRNSDFLRYVAGEIRKVNSLWIKNFKSDGNTFTLSGHALYRNRIHLLADVFESASISSVTATKIREKTVYSFTLTGKMPLQNKAGH